MKKLIAVIVLLLFASTITADAARKRTKITVTKRTPITERAIYQHPFAVDFVLRNILCAFHVFSIGPQGRPGSCADHMIQRPSHRVV